MNFTKLWGTPAERKARCRNVPTQIDYYNNKKKSFYSQPPDDFPSPVQFYIRSVLREFSAHG
jgi:hypothetical protein